MQQGFNGLVAGVLADIQGLADVLVSVTTSKSDSAGSEVWPAV